MLSSQTIAELRTWASAHERHGYVQSKQIVEVLDAYDVLLAEVERLKLLIPSGGLDHDP